MLEKGLTIGMGIFGAILGVHMADATTNPTDPKIVSFGKEAAGGAIFGLAGVNAGKELYSMIPQKGDSK